MKNEAWQAMRDKVQEELDIKGGAERVGFTDGEYFNTVANNLYPLKQRLLKHPVYKLIKDEESLKKFAELHVWSVWDFQCLLKALQVRLTCIGAPWTPTPDRQGRRLINEIVLDEETGRHWRDGEYASHFELYVEAMEAIGLDTAQIHKFISDVKEFPIRQCVVNNVPLPVQPFIQHTFEKIKQEETSALMAGFTFGREDIIPDMFRKIVEQIEMDDERFAPLKFYFMEHVEVDGERHAPMAKALIERLCGNDEKKWKEAERVGRECLEWRITLWDAIQRHLGVAHLPGVQEDTRSNMKQPGQVAKDFYSVKQPSKLDQLVATEERLSRLENKFDKLLDKLNADLT